MRAMDFFGVFAFIMVLVVWSEVQRLKRILRENGISAKGNRGLGNRLAEMVGQNVVISLHTMDGEVLGLSGQLCHVLDADETWALLLINEGKKKEYKKLIRLEDVKEIQVKK